MHVPTNVSARPPVPARCAVPIPTLLVAGRLVPIPVGVALELGTSRNVSLRLTGHGIAGRHACFVRLPAGGVLVRTLDPRAPVRCGGREIDSEVVEPGAALTLGRAVVVLGESGFSPRYPDAFRWQGMIARHPQSLAAMSRLARGAGRAAPVWVAGESGTGKELAARALHVASGRPGAFVGLNCAALPESLAEGELFGVRRGAFTGAATDRPGAFARADRGTVLLDEIGELSLAVQAKLLRALETSQVRPLGAQEDVSVDARVVAATWRDPEALVAAGAFRFDLAQRLDVLRVDLPPLRARPSDIGPLLEHFLVAHEAEDLWPEPDQLHALERARWPGNIRELRTRVTRAVVWGDATELAPAPARRSLPRRGAACDSVVIASVYRAIERAGGNRLEAARELGVSRSTLYRWLAREEARRGPHPTTLNPATLNPARPNPARLNPARLNPARLNPARLNPANPHALAGHEGDLRYGQA